MRVRVGRWICRLGRVYRPIRGRVCGPVTAGPATGPSALLPAARPSNNRRTASPPGWRLAADAAGSDHHGEQAVRTGSASATVSAPPPGVVDRARSGRGADGGGLRGDEGNLGEAQTAVQLPAVLHALALGQWSQVIARLGLTTADLTPAGPTSLQDVTSAAGLGARHRALDPRQRHRPGLPARRHHRLHPGRPARQPSALERLHPRPGPGARTVPGTLKRPATTVSPARQAGGAGPGKPNLLRQYVSALPPFCGSWVSAQRFALITDGQDGLDGGFADQVGQ